MTTKHTPGPWIMRPVDPHAAYGSRDVTTRGNGLVAQVWSGFRGDPAIAVANARLIAAAPDLLDALRDALGALRDANYKCDPLKAVAPAERAIHKATGETA